MKSCIIGIVSVAYFIASPVVADTMVIASPGMTLTDAAQAKFNRDTRPGDRHYKPIPGSGQPSRQLYAGAGVTPEEAQGWTLEELYVAKINRDSSGQNRQLAPGSVSLGYGQGSGDYSRLAHSAGLGADEAASMSVWEIANAKLNREH